MTVETSNAATEINGLNNGQDREDTSPREPSADSRQVGEPTGAARPAAAKGVLERRWRRRRDINSLPGLVREYGRLIAAMHSNRISLEKAEILSRAYGRHREMVTALEQSEQLKNIEAQLAALRGESSLLPRMDDSPESLEAPGNDVEVPT